MLRKLMIGTMAAALMTGASAGVASAEKIKIALIEGLSGPFAANGQAALRELKFAAEKFMPGKLEIIALDNKTSPQVTVSQLDKAIKQGVTYVVQGNSSGVAHAIVSYLDKHNKRSKNKVLFLNHSAVDPKLTNENCSFWHFRFDGHVGMKLRAMTTAIASNKDVKSVYIIGQDYSYGKAVAAGATKLLGLMRKDIKIVGNELHPVGKVKDFSPYAKKIQASKADVVITGNWGSDALRLVKALGDAKVTAKIYTFYGAGTGITKAIGASGTDRLLTVSATKNNPAGPDAWDAYRAEFAKKFPDADLLYPRMATIIRSLDAALKKAGGNDIVKVANALEETKLQKLDGSGLIMRKDDHQLLMPIHIAVHTDKGVKYDYDKSGFGTVVTQTIPTAKAALPTTCKMKRPK